MVANMNSPLPEQQKPMGFHALPASVRDVLTGILLVMAIILLLNRDLFGISSGETWAVSYGNF